MPLSTTSDGVALRVETRQPISFQVGHQQLFGMLHLPLIDTPAPALLICHGLAGDKNGRYRLYVTLAQRLAERGIACLRFDYRGCGDSEGDFSQVTVKSQLEDALAATHFLQKHPQINPQRLGIMGRSFGGLIAVLCARRSLAFSSLCLWSAVFDGEAWMPLWQQLNSGKMSSGQLDEALCFNGQRAGLALFRELFEVEMNQELTALSHTPLLHIHGAKDQRVAISHADKYQSCRQDDGTVSRFIRLPEGDHEITDLHEREEALEATIEWLRQTL